MHTKLLNEILRRLPNYADRSAALFDDGTNMSSQVENSHVAALRALNVSTARGVPHDNTRSSRSIQSRSNKDRGTPVVAAWGSPHGKRCTDRGPVPFKRPNVPLPEQCLPDRERAQEGDTIFLMICFPARQSWVQLVVRYLSNTSNGLPAKQTPKWQWCH